MVHRPKPLATLSHSVCSHPPSSPFLPAFNPKFLTVAPLGFGNWQMATALISGFTAKAAVISTLGVILKTGTGDLPRALNNMLSPLSAFSFLVFTLLYTPCVAAIAVIRKELGSGLAAFLVVIFQCSIAWLMAFLVYQLGQLIS